MKKHVITLSQINPAYTYSVKDDSPRGCHTAFYDDLKIGDKIVIDNYFHEIIEETPTEATETAEANEDTDTTTEAPTETEKTRAEFAKLCEDVETQPLPFRLGSRR